MLPTIIVQKSKHVWEEAQRCAEVAVIQQEFADRHFSATTESKPEEFFHYHKGQLQ